MIPALDMIVDQALALPEASRAFLAEKLLESLDQEEDVELSPAWRAEIQRRIKEIDEGRATLVPMEKVMSELRQRFG